MAKIPDIVGFDVATGSFLLNKKVHYDMKKHEVERLLDLVEYKGKKFQLEFILQRKILQKLTRF